MSNGIFEDNGPNKVHKPGEQTVVLGKMLPSLSRTLDQLHLIRDEEAHPDERARLFQDLQDWAAEQYMTAQDMVQISRAHPNADLIVRALIQENGPGVIMGFFVQQSPYAETTRRAGFSSEDLKERELPVAILVSTQQDFLIPSQREIDLMISPNNTFYSPEPVAMDYPHPGAVQIYGHRADGNIEVSPEDIVSSHQNVLKNAARNLFGGDATHIPASWNELAARAQFNYYEEVLPPTISEVPHSTPLSRVEWF